MEHPRPSTSGQVAKNGHNTVWNFHDFSITQILRENNFGDSRSAKSVTLTNLEVLNFDFYELFHFFKVKIYQMNISPKLISRKI